MIFSFHSLAHTRDHFGGKYSIFYRNQLIFNLSSSRLIPIYEVLEEV